MAVIDTPCRDGIAYVPFFPLGGFSPLQSSTVRVAARLGATPYASRASPGCCRRAANILLIPGTSSVGHLRENLACGTLSFRIMCSESWTGWRRRLETAGNRWGASFLLGSAVTHRACGAGPPIEGGSPPLHAHFFSACPF